MIETLFGKANGCNCGVGGMADDPAVSAQVEAGPSLDNLAEDTRLLVLAKAASALAEPVRLMILGLLREHGELTVGALTQLVPVSQPRVSVHLRCLTECGYTAVRRDGRRSFYRLAGPHIVGLLDGLRVHATDALDGLLACLTCAPPDQPGSQGGCG